MRYRIETAVPENLAELPYVWSVKLAKDGSCTVHAEMDKTAELQAVPGVTSVEVLGYDTIIEIGVSPEAKARLRQLWEQTPQILKDVCGILHINFGD